MDDKDVAAEKSRLTGELRSIASERIRDMSLEEAKRMVEIWKKAVRE